MIKQSKSWLKFKNRVDKKRKILKLKFQKETKETLKILKQKELISKLKLILKIKIKLTRKDQKL